MSDNVKQCKQCKTSEKMFSFLKQGEESGRFDFWNGFISPECSWKFRQNEFYIQDFKNDICPFCKNKLIDTMLTRDDFEAIGEYSNYNRDLLLAMIELRKKDVIEFETKMQPFRETYKKKQDQKEQKRQEYLANKDKTKCPKCGSTNIQIVPRKWSLLTGFMTNKTDRVCVNCKYKF